MSIHSIGPQNSIVGSCLQPLDAWKKTYQGQGEKIFKQIVTGAAYVGLTFVAAIETLARSLFAWLLYGLNTLLKCCLSDKGSFDQFVAESVLVANINAAMPLTCALLFIENFAPVDPAVEAAEAAAAKLNQAFRRMAGA